MRIVVLQIIATRNTSEIVAFYLMYELIYILENMVFLERCPHKLIEEL